NAARRISVPRAYLVEHDLFPKTGTHPGSSPGQAFQALFFPNGAPGLGPALVADVDDVHQAMTRMHGPAFLGPHAVPAARTKHHGQCRRLGDGLAHRSTTLFGPSTSIIATWVNSAHHISAEFGKPTGRKDGVRGYRRTASGAGVLYCLNSARMRLQLSGGASAVGSGSGSISASGSGPGSSGACRSG